MTRQNRWKVTLTAIFGEDLEVFKISGCVWSDDAYGIPGALAVACKTFNIQQSDLLYVEVEHRGSRTLDEAST